MTELSPIEKLVHDHVSDNVTAAFGTGTLPALVGYLRMICPSEDDLLLYSEHDRGATNTGRLIAVTSSHFAVLAFGEQDRNARFALEGTVYRLSDMGPVRFLEGSTAWYDRAGQSVTIEPTISVDVPEGEPVTFGRDGVFGWSPRRSLEAEGESELRDALVSRLLK